MTARRVLIAGVSTRALAESAARAGYRVLAVDGFSDLDLRACTDAVIRVRDAAGRFQAALAARAARPLVSPAVCYVASFENHPRAVKALTADRALLGNSPGVLTRVRSPEHLARALAHHGYATPQVRATRPPRHGATRWLVKPRASGGGHEIAPWRPGSGQRVPPSRYFQERIAGVPGSIVFAADGRRAVALGLSRLLVGKRAFGATGFRYCGNILAGAGNPQFAREAVLLAWGVAMAATLTRTFGLVGVNGVDFVARAGRPYPIEVNPRYTASMELVERAYGLSIFDIHVRACAGELPAFELFRARAADQGAVGKAVVYARHDVTVGDTRRWLGDDTVRDIPAPGERISRGQPICTVFARATDAAACQRGVGSARRRCVRRDRHTRRPRVMTAVSQRTEHATCLGCGCACDDITVVVRDQAITDAINACALGRSWFGDGKVPTEVRSSGRAVPLDQAVADAATLLAAAGRPLVYLAPDITSECQRASIGLADRLGAALDSPTSEIADGVLAAQRRGRAGATLGEIRQRADLLVFWGTDPTVRYPRYVSRYAVDPEGTQAPRGRKSRTVVAVDVGSCRSLEDADERFTISSDDEVDALGAMRAAVLGRSTGAAALDGVEQLARRMAQARYSVIVHDAEPGNLAAQAERAEALIALAEALNGPSRCALSLLRAGGNRSGADLALTWQAGYPMAVDFAPGYPSYRPHAGATGWLQQGEVDVALVVGSATGLPEAVLRGLAAVRTVVIGPGATATHLDAVVAIDTGVAGIHESGTAFRMDDVPLPLRAALQGSTAALPLLTIVRALSDRLEGR